MGNCCPSTDHKPAEPVVASPAENDHKMSAFIDDLIDGAGVASTPDTPSSRTATVDIQLLAAKREKDFSFEGMRFLAKIVDYYDGDTVRVVFRFGGKLAQYRTRLVGYDSPEMKPPKSQPDRIQEIEAARTARKALIEKTLDHATELPLVFIECGGFDKYGRVLITIYLRNNDENGENVNDWMIQNGYGVAYNGGKKTAFGDL